MPLHFPVFGFESFELQPLHAVYSFIIMPLFSMGKAIVAGKLEFLSHAWGASRQSRASFSFAIWQAFAFQVFGVELFGPYLFTNLSINHCLRKSFTVTVLCFECFDPHAC